MPGSHRGPRAGVLGGRRIAADPAQGVDQPVVQPPRRMSTAHVDREVQQTRLGIDITVMAQQRPLVVGHRRESIETAYG